MLVCTKYQHESTVGLTVPLHLNIPPTALPTPPLRSLQSPTLNSLSHTANSHWLSILHMVIYMFPFYSLHISYPLLPPAPCPHVYSLCLCLHCCPPNRFISTIFLDSICYELIYNICFSFSDLLHSV